MAQASGGALMGAVAVSLLGRFSVVVNGQAEVRLPHGAQRLLAYLLVHRERGHPSDQLAERLRTAAPGGAKAALRESMAQLDDALGRHVAGGSLLDRGVSEISLSAGADLQVDLWAFVEGATEYAGTEGAVLDAATLGPAMALERLYQGHLLEGWPEPWCHAPREHVLRLYAHLLDRILAAHEAADDLTKVVLYATRSLAASPARESAHRSLIRALYRLGDRSGALRQVQRCEDTARTAGGGELEPETTALIELVRAGTSRASRRATEGAD